MKNMTDNRRMISLEIDYDLLEPFDAIAADLEMNRSDLIRALIYALIEKKVTFTE